MFKIDILLLFCVQHGCIITKSSAGGSYLIILFPDMELQPKLFPKNTQFFQLFQCNVFNLFQQNIELFFVLLFATFYIYKQQWYQRTESTMHNNNIHYYSSQTRSFSSVWIWSSWNKQTIKIMASTHNLIILISQSISLSIAPYFIAQCKMIFSSNPK